KTPPAFVAGGVVRLLLIVVIQIAAPVLELSCNSTRILLQSRGREEEERMKTRQGKFKTLQRQLSAAVQAANPHVAAVACNLAIRLIFLGLVVFCYSFNAQTGGVTLVTHGWNGNVTDWIIPMAEAMPQYSGFSDFSCYEIYWVQDAQGVYHPTQSRIGGVNPTNSQSGEIFVKLDWSQISVSLAVSTTDIAEIVTPLLLSTSFIPELGGKALAELPIHLIGHSRGGSVVSEMARIFGQHGIWVDHVTTLDPHPVSLYNDASVSLYWNILFADNYWQT